MTSAKSLLLKLTDEELVQEIKRRGIVVTSKPKPLDSINLIPFIDACEIYTDSWYLVEGREKKRLELVKFLNKLLEIVYGEAIWKWNRLIQEGSPNDSYPN